MQTIPRTIAVCGDGLIADAVAVALRGLATVTVITSPHPLPDLHQWDGLIVACDNENHLAHQPSPTSQPSPTRPIPWLPIRVEPNVAVIGPLTTPARPGCPVCFQLRRQHNRPPEPTQTDGPTGPPSPPEPDPPELDHLAAGLIATLAVAEFAAQHPATPSSPHRDVMLVRLSDLTIERHAFLPEPMCPACGDLPDDTEPDARIVLASRPKRSPTQYRLWSPAEHSADIMTTYVDSEAGLIHDIARTDECGLAVAQASVTLRIPGVSVPGGGRTWDYRTSEAVAVLEALERYGGSNPSGKRTVVRAARADLDQPTLDPRRLGAHEDDVYDQMPHLYRPFTEESVCNWVWGYSLTDDVPLLVPESCAYFWTLNHPDPAFLADTTNGCALGSCLEEAILYGILEVAERDAFLLTWHAQIPARAIDLDAADDRDPAIVAAAITQATGYQVSLFDITTEIGIPSVWAMATHPGLAQGGGDGRRGQGLPPGGDDIALFCAAGSHLVPERAALSALTELGPQLADAIKRFPGRKAAAAASLTSPDVVKTIFDHAVAFGDPRAYSRLDFLAGSPARPRPLAEIGGNRAPAKHDDLREDLLDLVGRLRAENLEVIVIDQTGPEHRALGLHCVRVLIPGTLPLTYGHRRRRLRNLPRLLTLPQRLGYRETALSMAGVNQLPHPFAA